MAPAGPAHSAALRRLRRARDKPPPSALPRLRPRAAARAVGAPDPGRPPRAAAAGANRDLRPASAAGDGGDDADFVAVLELRLEPVKKAHVLVADVDVDEAPDALVVEQAIAHSGVLGLE